MELEITKGGGDRPVCGPEAKKKSEMGAPIHRTHTKKKSHHLLLLLLYNSFTAVTSTSVSRGGGGGDRTKPPSPVVSPNVAWARKETLFLTSQWETMD